MRYLEHIKSFASDAKIAVHLDHPGESDLNLESGISLQHAESYFSSTSKVILELGGLTADYMQPDEGSVLMYIIDEITYIGLADDKWYYLPTVEAEALIYDDPLVDFESLDPRNLKVLLENACDIQVCKEDERTITFRIKLDRDYYAPAYGGGTRAGHTGLSKLMAEMPLDASRQTSWEVSSDMETINTVTIQKKDGKILELDSEITYYKLHSSFEVTCDSLTVVRKFGFCNQWQSIAPPPQVETARPWKQGSGPNI